MTNLRRRIVTELGWLRRLLTLYALTALIALATQPGGHYSGCSCGYGRLAGCVAYQTGILCPAEEITLFFGNTGAEPLAEAPPPSREDYVACQVPEACGAAPFPLLPRAHAPPTCV